MKETALEHRGPWLLYPDDTSPLQPPPPKQDWRDCDYCVRGEDHTQALHQYQLDTVDVRRRFQKTPKHS